MSRGEDRSELEAGGRILIIDDEPAIVESLELLLKSAGHDVRSALTGAAGVEAVAREECDLVLLDLMLPDRSGIEVLTAIRAVDRTLPVVMLTAFGSIERAVEATRLGATNFLTKPWNNAKLLLEIGQTLERRRLEIENSRLRGQLGQAGSMGTLIGQSEAMLQMLVLIRQVAASTSTVLLTGESGTGKDLLAHAIHESSPRASKPFITVSSSRIPSELLASALFGHVHGAFPGATEDRQGCFAIAHEGTLFLDEVSTLPEKAQADLLRVLQDREIVPVGSNDPVAVDVRIVAASNADLEAAVRNGTFREDLYYRLNVIGIEVPPLRKRADDIPLLVEEFLTQICRSERNHFLDSERRSTLRFDPDAMRILARHSWPGNVRELHNVVERAVVLATSERLTPELLPERLTSRDVGQSRVDRGEGLQGEGASLAEIMGDFERKLLTRELERHGYNQTETAKSLRVALSTLNQKIQRLGIRTRPRRSK